MGLEIGIISKIKEVLSGRPEDKSYQQEISDLLQQVEDFKKSAIENPEENLKLGLTSLKLCKKIIGKFPSIRKENKQARFFYYLLFAETLYTALQALKKAMDGSPSDPSLDSLTIDLCQIDRSIPQVINELSKINFLSSKKSDYNKVKTSALAKLYYAQGVVSFLFNENKKAVAYLNEARYINPTEVFLVDLLTVLQITKEGLTRIKTRKVEEIIFSLTFSPYSGPKVELGRAEKLPPALPEGLGATFDPYKNKPEKREVILDNGKKGKIFSWGLVKFYQKETGLLVGYYGGNLTFFDLGGRPWVKLGRPDEYLKNRKEKDLCFIPIYTNEASPKQIGHLVIDSRGAGTVLRLMDLNGKTIAESNKFASMDLDFVSSYDPIPSDFSGAVVDEAGNLIGVVGGKKDVPPHADR